MLFKAHINRHTLTDVPLAHYFRDRLLETLKQAQQPTPPPHIDTIWYLSKLLERFSDSAQLFSYDRGRLSVRPLALLYGDAQETSNKHDRCLILRQLGDLTLFMGALFPETFKRRGIRKDYIVGMGGGAYDYLAEHADRHRPIFSQLANQFSSLLPLVSKACAKEQCFDFSDVLQLLQRWEESHDPAIERQLAALGIPLESSQKLH